MRPQLESQKDKLGQRVNIGDDLVVSYLEGRRHVFKRAKCVGMTPQMAELVGGRKVRFYNTVVINAIVRQPQGGVSTAETMANAL